MVRHASPEDGVGVFALDAILVDFYVRNHEVVEALDGFAESELGWAPTRIGEAPNPGFPRWLGLRLTSYPAFGRKVRSLRGER
jgi:hypothetical protein